MEYSALKMETVRFSETLVSSYKSTEQHHHINHREEFKFLLCVAQQVIVSLKLVTLNQFHETSFSVYDLPKYLCCCSAA
jgi:hypothetical protein